MADDEREVEENGSEHGDEYGDTSRSPALHVSVPASEEDSEEMTPPVDQKPSTSTSRSNRSRYLNSKFCPCFSPSVSDDDGDEPDVPEAPPQTARPLQPSSSQASNLLTCSLLAARPPIWWPGIL
uniref:Uncharacterized protein n=1 Tax=Steinernema glaseri TaxID=37863 RepID=A0A1I7Z6F8_9BILA